jgi:signal transduction histidine kinase/CheY-like chemotaxis protein
MLHLHAIIRAFFDPSGVPERYIGVVADSTRARVAEAALARSEERFRTMADTAPMMICASGPDRLATYFNRAWLTFTGRGLDRELGYGWTEGLHPDDLEHAMAGYAASFAMRLLVGGIAHDLNNLMNAIQVQTELVEAETADGLSPQMSVRRLRGVASRAAEIVRELMIYSGEDKATLEPVHVSRVIEEMLELLRISISKRARLETDLARHLPYVFGNVTQVRQVVMNLVINASEAIGDKEGTIRIATSKASIVEDPSGGGTIAPAEGEYVRLEIADTGSGMSEEARARIFERSFTTKARGHGMGLAVVQGIVRSHGGVVNVTSALGHGTTFEVLLPCASGLTGCVPRMAPAVALSAVSARPRTVLLVEQEEHLRISVGKALRRRGFSVLSAPDAQTAQRTLQERAEEIDVIVLDPPPRARSAREILRQLRAIREELPIILTYTETQPGNSPPEGRVSYLRKPYRIADLIERLRGAISDTDADGHSEVAEAGSD